MVTGETWRLGRRPALDGLRGVAVLLVMASHVGNLSFIAAGPVGVTVFFALSGFLITALLLEERERSGRVDLRAFYLRRARRLLPALVAFLAAMLVVGTVTFGEVVPVVLYVANFVQIYDAMPNSIMHTWSLSVEEQFYLVFPLAMIALRRASRLTLGTILTLGIVASVALRIALWSPYTGRAYFGTDTNAFALLAGCLLAVVAHGRPSWVSRPLWGGVALLALVPWCLVGEGAVARVFAPVAAAGLTVAAIYCFVGTDTASSWLAHPALAWLGRRSYAVYLWHLPLILLPFAAGVQIAAALAVAELSWRFVERPWLRRTNERRSAVGRARREVRQSPKHGALHRREARPALDAH